MPESAFFPGPKILIVEDEAANRKYLEKILDVGGYDHVLSVPDGVQAIEQYVIFDPDLILLDLHMPEMDGYDVLRILGERKISDVYLPVLVFTADATPEARKAALELGASDFLTKPGDATEILLRVKNFLKMRAWNMALNDRNIDLEIRVRERTAELEQSQMEIVERLALAGEHRDDDTGQHTHRVGELSGRIAHRLDMPQQFVRLITQAARLHDLGKLGIPDSILLKPGKLTDEEFEQMKTHCEIGAKILSKSRTPLLQMAEQIACCHHERYDGNGYPNRLSGEDIPMAARIVSVADVFDALTNERPYKKAWPVSEAVSEITAQKGRQFDPHVVEAFLAVLPES